VIKPAHKFLLTLFAVALALPGLGASERAETLRAINWVENPTNHTRRGSRGELGPYQFMPHTWRLHTRAPFSQAVLRAQADLIAVKHYEWLKDGLREAGIDPNPYNIALAWNCGLGAVKSGRIPAVSYGYAERVQNLVEQQRARRQAALAAATRESATQPALPTAASAESDRETSQSKSMFTFNPAGSDAPRFVVATVKPLYSPSIPTLVTEKSVAVASVTPVRAEPAASRATVTIEEAPMFTVSSVTQPRFALIR
jgi:hypothetical protein